MHNEQKQRDTLSPFEWNALNLIHHYPNIKYREIAYACNIPPREARELVSGARICFAEMHGIAPEALDLDASKGKHSPQITDEERRLLQAYFIQERERIQVPPDFRENVLRGLELRGLGPTEQEIKRVAIGTSNEDTTNSLWVQDLEQERQNSNKWQR